MRKWLRQLQPTSIEDLIALVALYRPGPMDQIPTYIERRHGQAALVYDHPAMEPSLRETCGIMMYQEQVMQIAADVAGFTLGRADILRRAIGKKDAQLMAQQREQFLAGAVARGVPGPTADRIFRLIAHFADYGFNKSHAAAYALLAYQTAYLKAHYPVEYMAALLTAEADSVAKLGKYAGECRVVGIAIRPPDVNAADAGFQVLGAGLRCGLGAVRGLGEKAVRAILAARQAHGRFLDLQDFCRRVDRRLVNKRAIEALIKAGALDGFGLRRSQLAAMLLGKKTRGQAAAPDIPEWDRVALLAVERETLGFYVSGHPLADHPGLRFVPGGGTTTSALPGHPDEAPVQLAAVVTAVQELSTRRGERMAFVALEDLEGAVEAVAFPDTYGAVKAVLAAHAVVLVDGRVDLTDGDRLKLVLTRVRPITNSGVGHEPGEAAAARR